jgi:integrase
MLIAVAVSGVNVAVDVADLPVGPLFCITHAATRGRPWAGAAVRHEFRRLAGSGGRPAPVRAASAASRARAGARPRGVPLNIVQRQLGHTNLGTTSSYLRGIDPEDIIATVRMRRAPMMSITAGLRL